jgi:signal transduction histidine kinase
LRERLAATGEILRVIARSPTDVQPVFDTIAAAAMKLCNAGSANVFTFDGRLLQIGTLMVAVPAAEAAMRRVFPRPPDRGTAASRAVLTRAVAAIADAALDPDYALHGAGELGFRSVVGIPLLRDGEPIGAIAVGKSEPGPFPPQQVALLQTFADQAVIAIENARLFHELAEKSRQLEVASRHKSAFLASMSHELRTPLNAIIGFARIVLRRSRDRIEDTQVENLERILASALHLLSLINAVLDLAKVEAGKVEVRCAEVQLADLLEQCVRAVEPLAQDGVAMQRDFSAPLPPLWTDGEKLRQIVFNLLSNAAKFTAAGQIRVSARATGGQVAIAVADTGIGIPATKLDAVFEEFEQVQPGAARAQGTGLGLAISRRLARLMGGELAAASTLGVGSTFTLTLPLRHGEAQP